MLMPHYFCLESVLSTPLVGRLQGGFQLNFNCLMHRLILYLTLLRQQGGKLIPGCGRSLDLPGKQHI